MPGTPDGSKHRTEGYPGKKAQKSGEAIKRHWYLRISEPRLCHVGNDRQQSHNEHRPRAVSWFLISPKDYVSSGSTPYSYHSEKSISEK